MTGCNRCHGGWLLADDDGQGVARRCSCVAAPMERERQQKVSELGPVRRPEDGYQPDRFPDGTAEGKPLLRPEQTGGDGR